VLQCSGGIYSGLTRHNARIPDPAHKDNNETTSPFC
jgi:hypothetical protein